MRVRVIAGGIYGADGELPIGAEFAIGGPIPPGWSDRVEAIEDAPSNAEPITNPRKRRG